MSHRAVRVTAVAQGGPAAGAGVRVGDRVLAVDGEELLDSLDFSLLANEPVVELALLRGGEVHEVVLEREWGESLGLTVDHRPRACRLDCRFCFVGQQPKGMRGSLCLRDDDLALSFRDGNFVTLSNVDEEDLERACALSLSPLYVSVHATDPGVRAGLLRPRGPAGRDVLPALRRLLDAEITVHAQIVLVPGANDGAALERTLADLAPLVPGIASIAVVPVGLTRYQRDPTLRPWRPDESPALLAQLEPWRERFRAAHGVPIVTPSDEWYLLSSLDPPPAADYDAYPQMENGVGLVRSFLDDLHAAVAAPTDRLPQAAGRRVLLATGRLARPVLAWAAIAFAAETEATIEVVGLESPFWGPHVTVAGLLTGEDLRDGLAPHLDGGRWDAVIIPDIVLNDDGRFLDDHTASWLEGALRRPVTFVTPDVAGLREGLRQVLG